jgi:hypothetical protein
MAKLFKNIFTEFNGVGRAGFIWLRARCYSKISVSAKGN